jgi:hypothetical protein
MTGTFLYLGLSYNASSQKRPTLTTSVPVLNITLILILLDHVVFLLLAGENKDCVTLYLLITQLPAQGVEGTG